METPSDVLDELFKNTEITSEIELWRYVVNLAKKDLHSQDSRLVYNAAVYFFTEGDAGDISTFTGLCAIRGYDADRAAKRIFDCLPIRKKLRICSLFNTSGYVTRAVAS